MKARHLSPRIRRLGTAFARLLSLLALLLALQPAHAAGFVGAYVWGGLVQKGTPLESFHHTVGLVLDSGFDTVRFAITPDAGREYGSTAACGKAPTLPCQARVLLDSPVWDHPGLRRIMLTAHDFTAHSAAPDNAGYFTDRLLRERREEIIAEYTQLFEVLESRFRQRRIQFILSNWEGDNLVYCGQTWAYSREPAKAQECQRRYPRLGNAQRVRGFLQWVGYKDEAVARFVASHPRMNLVHAPELNNITLFDQGCSGLCDPASDTIANQLAQAGGRAWCSYSSYESQGPDYAEKVLALGRACRRIIIGEAGYDLKRNPPERARELFAQARRLLDLERGGRNPVVGFIPWNAVDPADGSLRFGLFDPQGRPQVLELMGPLRPRAGRAEPRR